MSYRIRRLRENRGESQQAFADRLQISIQTLANYEYRTPAIGSAEMWLKFWREAEYQDSKYAADFREAFFASVGSDSHELRKLLPVTD